MNKLILLFSIYFVFIANYKAQEKQIKEGEWIQLSITKKDTIIYNPCLSENRKIIIKNDNLIDYTGQETISCKINSFFSKKGWQYIILEKHCSYSDTIAYKEINNNILQWKLYNNVSFYSTSSSSRKNYRVVNEKCNDDKATVPIQEKKDIFLYNFIKEGITPQNILSSKSKTIIESIIGNYTTMDDYGSDQFYEREVSKLKNYNITEEQMKIWNLCLSKLNFEDVADHDKIENDWRYPYDRLNFAKKIMDLYKDTRYGDSWQHITNTPKYHIALYMYFLPWKERKVVYEEIESLKRNISPDNSIFTGKYRITIPKGMVRENSPELKLQFDIESNKVTIVTFLDNKINDTFQTNGLIKDNRFIINFVQNGQKEEYIITVKNNDYVLSGSTIQELNPLSEEVSLIKL